MFAPLPLRCLALSLALLTAEAWAQTPPPAPAGPKTVPPKGVAIPEKDRQELEAGAAALKKEIDALTRDLRAKPQLARLLPDVEIFHKAVDWALRYDEFFDPKQTGAAREQLTEGMARAKALKAGQAPWTTASGLVVRGYRSRIDGSVQPYGLVIPASFNASDRTRRYRMDLWQHGRAEKLSELAFIQERMKSKGEFAPENAFVLHAYGRFCNATKFAGETDVFEGLEHARASYPIDPARLVIRGFSMGGASAWHLAVHHAGLWAAAAPGAGFSDTAEYGNVFGAGKTPPPWWEQVLWRMYDADIYARNLFNCPVVAYSGEEDKQKLAADMMARDMEKEGLKLVHLIGPKTGHKYEPETKKELSRQIDALAEKGREEMPPRVRFVTYTLRYNQMEWVRIDGLEKHWERATVDAEIVDEGTLKAETSNVSALSFTIEAKPAPFDKTRAPRVVLDGQELVGPAVTSPWIASFKKENGKWQNAGAAAPGLRKQHGLQGPIDDAFIDSFVFVRPTGRALNETVGSWARAEMERAIPQWRTVFRGDARVVDDTAVTPEMIAGANLVLWGDPASNAVLKRILPQLPVKWAADKVSLGKASYPATHTAPVFIFPNPLNPRRYIVVNSSFTFREGASISNAQQVPQLPDWAFIDLRTPPSNQAPGLVIEAGFFGERWESLR